MEVTEFEQIASNMRPKLTAHCLRYLGGRPLVVDAEDIVQETLVRLWKMGDKLYQYQSIEEEKALANFYRHCKVEDLTEEELGIRNLMLGIENYTQTSESDDLASETKVQTTPKVASRNHSSWSSSIRISSILLAAAMIAGLIFLVFPVKEIFSSKTALTSYAPTSTVVRSYQSSIDESNESLSPAEEMERQDSLFLAATKDIEVPSSRNNYKIEQHPSRNNAHKTKTNDVTTRKAPKNKSKEDTEGIEEHEVLEESANDFNHYYEVASLALPSADQLKIDKQGNNIIVTTTDEEGNVQHFTIDTSDANEGLYQIHPLAQL